jgi:catechol 2,3-dioxygenase-like lactoylglutathione lyase family enzyme
VSFAAKETFVVLYHPDMSAGRRFYEEVLGLAIREVTYEWFVGYWLDEQHKTTLAISSSPEEIEKWGAAGKGVVIELVVANVDEVCARLEAKGVTLDERPNDKPWGLRTAALRDPAGYTITFSAYIR